jgi:hypothetical protein
MSLRKRQVGFQQDEDNKNNDAGKDDGNTYTKLDKDDGDGRHDSRGASSPTKSLVVAPNNKRSIVDRWLQAYTKFTSSAFSQDKGLKTLQYTLWLVGRFYAPTSVQSQSLNTISEEISWARYINRLFGLPAAIEAARSGSWGSPTKLGKAMAWSMIAYYPLEHVAYLKWKAPKLTFGRTINNNNKKQNTGENHGSLAAKASAWSCRFWLVYIVLDIARSTMALRKIKESNADNDNGNHQAESESDVQTRRSERLQILRNVLFTIPAIQWALPKWDVDPWLSSDVINGLAWLESVVCLYQGIDNFKALSSSSS